LGKCLSTSKREFGKKKRERAGEVIHVKKKKWSTPSTRYTARPRYKVAISACIPDHRRKKKDPRRHAAMVAWFAEREREEMSFVTTCWIVPGRGLYLPQSLFP